eukprot:TRINITY_DN6113_c0_g1_i14.p2 TRINITY_DN6113_c0_g1~~TRINITY_DN6113_c0_g1_i14.p2  ORF type:complete len:144 (-),score=28.60 TRINITY_DN6113_c0_g1_i14:104-535(-)
MDGILADGIVNTSTNRRCKLSMDDQLTPLSWSAVAGSTNTAVSRGSSPCYCAENKIMSASSSMANSQQQIREERKGEKEAHPFSLFVLSQTAINKHSDRSPSQRAQHLLEDLTNHVNLLHSFGECSLHRRRSEGRAIVPSVKS